MGGKKEGGREGGSESRGQGRAGLDGDVTYHHSRGRRSGREWEWRGLAVQVREMRMDGGEGCRGRGVREGEMRHQRADRRGE